MCSIPYYDIFLYKSSLRYQLPDYIFEAYLPPILTLEIKMERICQDNCFSRLVISLFRRHFLPFIEQKCHDIFLFC